MSINIYERANAPKNRFMHHNFMVLESADDTAAVVRLEIRDESKNPGGMVHGGALCAMADNATGAVAHGDGRSYVTQSSTMNFLGNQSSGVIRAYAKLRHRGRSTCLVDVDIRNEEQKLLATGTATLFCVGRLQE